MVLRAVVATAIVLALAETRIYRTSQAVCVIYLLDQSKSVAAEQRESMLDYVVQDVATHRRDQRGDLAGVIVFGREAAVEVPPIADDLSFLRRFESVVPNLSEATDLSAAMALASSMFPDGCARRVVLVTDGNENLGSAKQIAARYASLGMGIDVVAVPILQRNDVAIEKIVVPSTVRRGATVEGRTVVVSDVEGPQDQTDSTQNPQQTQKVSGTLTISRRSGSNIERLSVHRVELEPGKNVFPFVHKANDEPGFYTYEAHFQSQATAVERSYENNEAIAYTLVKGRGRVLFIENPDTQGQFDYLVERLRAADMEITRRRGDDAFASFAELQSYDSVVLANLPRTSSSAAATLSEQQVEMLCRNTEAGCGLVILGGPESFGAGGWANTPLEKASPVEFTIHNAKVVPAGALVLVLDKSGSMRGEKLTMSRRAAMEAMTVLGAKDYVGVVAFDGATEWILPLQQIGSRREQLPRKLYRLESGGGTVMFPAIERGFRALQPVDAAVKHMIVLTDGQTEEAPFDQLARDMKQAGVTLSTIAIGRDADRTRLARVARNGGGKFYNVANAQAIPRVFVKEAMRVARPLLYERPEGIAPQIVGSHEVLKGIAAPLPPVTGFVLTKTKANPLVQVAVSSPLPVGLGNSTILASWNYGLGRSAVLTTDAGDRWAAAWREWPHYDQLYEQLVRWSMRPGSDSDGGMSVATQIVDGKLKATVTALDEDDRLHSFMTLSARVIKPNLSVQPIAMQQSAPGRYEGELAIDEPGSYFMTIASGNGQMIRTGVTVPNSIELQDRTVNWTLLESLRSQTPEGGEPGAMTENRLERGRVSPSPIDTFRPTLAASRHMDDLWPILIVIAACMFWFDIASRRISIDFDIWIARYLLRNPAPTEAVALARLTPRRDHDSRRWSSPTHHTDSVLSIDMNRSATDSSTSLPRSDSGASEANGTKEEDTSSYTARLLRVKTETPRTPMGRRIDVSGDREEE